MNDSLDVELQDGELLEEIRLTAALMVSASATACPLSREAIDEALFAAPAKGGDWLRRSAGTP